MPRTRNTMNITDSIRDIEAVTSADLVRMITEALHFAVEERHQFVVPETMLRVMLRDRAVAGFMRDHRVDPRLLAAEVDDYLDGLERVPEGKKFKPALSVAFQAIFHSAANLAGEDGRKLTPDYVLAAIYAIDKTEAHSILARHISSRRMKSIMKDYSEYCATREDGRDAGYEDEEMPYDDEADAEEAQDDMACRRVDEDPEFSGEHFHGRDDDIRRAVISLLKRKRGHVVFVGDRGVGKSEMLSGLIKASKRLYEPGSRFGGARFYKFNPSAVVTGVSYADEIENHVADIIDDIGGKGGDGEAPEMAVIFADSLADLMPQNPNDNTPDTLRLLASLVDGTDIHIVTTATYEQFKRLAQHNQAIEKSFTRIDLVEPKLDPDCREMVRAAYGPILEQHALSCEPAVVDYVVDAAATSYTKEVAMPGRALDLFDSVCAFVEMENGRRGADPEGRRGVFGRDDVDLYLKAMGFDTIASRESKDERLRELEPNMLSKIFGQDEAVHGVAQSVLLAKAGLSDDAKPLASYLFVGPTGVGKTELARVLAAELGAKLVRFDMSEYSEPHTVSKLVGSPAGYVGYDDGGLLTDAVRKTPNCVLLFDEIEKAHAAVFNLLLQVLDYAKLTDNKGQKADFSGAIIIMTSNAGARFATGRGLGFGASAEKSEVMGAELKRVFAPEFLNRLTQIVAFHDMTRAMAERILDRKVGELQALLRKKRSVDFDLSDQARAALLDAGFSSQYGAREMDRAIGRLLKPALMETLLFGGSAEGDRLDVDAEGDKLVARRRVAAPGGLFG